MNVLEAQKRFPISGSTADVDQFWDGVFVDGDQTIVQLEEMFCYWLGLAGEFYHACILPAFNAKWDRNANQTLLNRMFALYTAMCEAEIEF